ncbi:MinD/ParA family protein [Photobacterium galatheae]|uniref:Cobyrinic acid a,c-diamide synthase n=1 Tax=Photobacterium galatheae TaxID=1654360 RepID=A0A066S0A4_9GAMM|nr:MinD/ParA family protein [Photobacterium galatheae]KDM93068.1 cobyrinic acid a,c-diamide synthase [Photobacterium galatheae]MCM0148403.1 MinD/ParA family protein [Photobacterium galatheae]
MIEKTMHDQASGLRRMTKLATTKVITVSGGKGGVGKTNITLNMALAMGRQGKRVMVLDADLGLANVDVMLGLRAGRNLSHVLSGVCDLQDIIIEGPYGVKIVPASSGTQNMAELSSAQHIGLIRAFATLEDEIDVLLVDTAAGISDMVLSFAGAAQDVLVVVCDEPTSITDAYALIKILNREYHVQRFKIVANMVRSYREGRELFAKLTRVTERFLQANLELVACIPLDDRVRQSIKRQKVVVEAFPRSPAALALTTLANKALTWPVPNNPGGHLEFFVEKLLVKPTPEEVPLGE